jgi:hypothetical protein
MMEANMLSMSRAPKPAVYVEPSGDPQSGRTAVRVVFSYRSGPRSDVREFESLGEALAYAQRVLAEEAEPAV